MKKLICIGYLCFLSLHVLAQNYSIERIKMDDFVADYAEEIIQKSTPTDNRHYAYILSQNDKEFEIRCNVTPDNLSVTEQTDDVWNEMEATIIRVINKVKSSLAPVQSQSFSSETEQPVLQQSSRETYVAPQTTIVVTPTQQDIVQHGQQYYLQKQSQTNQNQPVQTYPQNNFQSQQPIQNNSNNYNNPQMNFYGNMGYLQPQSYSIEDVRSGRAILGGKIWFDDGSFGIIFFLDGMGHGLAVSLDETETQWQDAKKSRYCQDIHQLMNESEPSKYCNSGLGAQQTQMIINQLGWGQAPAAEWCTRHGNGWYLPSAGELWYLFTVANYSSNDKGDGKNNPPDAKDGFISKMLQVAGGQPIDSYWYWSSSEEEQESAWNVSASGRCSSEDKTNEVAVRAVRYF